MGLPAVTGAIVLLLLVPLPAAALPIAPDAGPVETLEGGGAPSTAAREVFYAGGRRQPSMTVSAAVAGPVGVEVVDDSGEVVHRMTVMAGPGMRTVSWDGTTAGGFARTGTYSLRPEGSEAAAAPFVLRDHAFPIRGPHDLGRTATNSFGGGRGHDGQDMFARCGTPIVAARGGTVREVAYNGGGGHHLVIRSRDTGLDYVYMHLRSAPPVEEGDVVATHQRIGVVGRSGNAWGCHLHLELWTAPGWYEGGHAFDPLPRLRSWDRSS